MAYLHERTILREPDPPAVGLWSRWIDGLMRSGPIIAVTLAVLIASIGIVLAWTADSPTLSQLTLAISDRSR